MNNLVGGLAAVMLALSAVPTTAAPAPAAVTTQSREAEAVRDWLSAVATWTQGYDALTTRQVETLGWLIDGADVLVAKLQAGGPQAARPWAATWAAEAETRLAADMDTYTSLSTQAPRFPANVPLTPELRERIETISQTSDQVGTMMVSVRQASQDYIRVIGAAASGKEEDLALIDSARLGLMAAQLEAEITMMQSASAGLTGPNLYFARTQTASNRALIIWLGHNKRLFSDQPTDAPGAARGVREQSATMRREVANMRGAIGAFGLNLRAEAGFTETPLGQLFLKVMETLERSAGVEERLADAIDELAEAILSSDELADDVAAAKIEGLANERIAIDAERRQLIAQSGG